MPVFQADSKILILGSFPSVKTREYGFFYGHPQNRFWLLLERKPLVDIEEKRAFPLLHNLFTHSYIHHRDERTVVHSDSSS